jgi:putative Mn2+ efflux pump MntP
MLTFTVLGIKCRAAVWGHFRQSRCRPKQEEPLTGLNILAISVALAMDAFAVSIATGICLGRIHWRQNFRLAWHFGLFQALMPIVGWTAGLTVRDLIASFDHWVAFFLLAFVAFGMLREATKADDQCETVKDPTKGATMVMLSVATSLDALAVGLSLSVINVSIWIPAAFIGVVACLFTTIGLHLGKRIGRAASVRRFAEGLGAVVLLLIGLNILREHGVFAMS